MDRIPWATISRGSATWRISAATPAIATASLALASTAGNWRSRVQRAIPPTERDRGFAVASGY